MFCTAATPFYIPTSNARGVPVGLTFVIVCLTAIVSGFLYIESFFMLFMQLHSSPFS